FGGTPSAASFVTTDTTTQGNWQSTYGAEGYSISGGTTSYPIYAQVTSTAQGPYVWSNSTTDVRALQQANGSGRVAAFWYGANNGSFIIDINLTDHKTHQVAVYVLDFTANNGPESIDVLDANTGAMLNTQTVSSFYGGKYLVWNLQ